jgi:hypothetical protein
MSGYGPKIKLITRDGTTPNMPAMILQYPIHSTIATGQSQTDAILNALGGYGICSAIVLTGGSDLWRKENKGRPPHYPTQFSQTDPDATDNAGGIAAEVFVDWAVNAGRNRHWRMYVALEPDAALSIYLVRRKTQNIELLGEQHKITVPSGVTASKELIDACNELYCAAVNKHLGGFIPLE